MIWTSAVFPWRRNLKHWIALKGKKLTFNHCKGQRVWERESGSERVKRAFTHCSLPLLILSLLRMFGCRGPIHKNTSESVHPTRAFTFLSLKCKVWSESASGCRCYFCLSVFMHASSMGCPCTSLPFHSTSRVLGWSDIVTHRSNKARLDCPIKLNMRLPSFLPRLFFHIVPWA
jgi:hypothetical protein